MSEPIILILNGPPGAGKTTLGRQLAKDLSLPFIGKDDVKEILFDVLGWRDRAWSMQLGLASIELIFHHLKCQVAAGQSAVTETAFIPQFDTERFLKLKQMHNFEPMQIYCTADPLVLTERFFVRNETGERHPGHGDYTAGRADFLNVVESDKYGVLDIGGTLRKLNTTDFGSIDYDTLLAEIKQDMGL